MTTVEELLEVQGRLVDRANTFLALFGQDADSTLTLIDKAYKSLPPGLSLSLINSLPKEEDLAKAIAMEEKLAPLVQLSQQLLDDINANIDQFGEEEKLAINEQLERGDLFIALLERYFAYLWSQLGLEDKRQVLAKKLKHLENQLLNIDISANLVLCLNQYKTFPRVTGAKKRAKKMIMEFMKGYESLDQQYRDVSQQLFCCYDVQPVEPWFGMDETLEPTATKKDLWRIKISHSIDNLMAVVQDKLLKLTPCQNPDGSALHFSPQVAEHLNKIHDDMVKWDFDSYLDEQKLDSSKQIDLSLKSEAITQLATGCKKAEEKLSTCLLNLEQAAQDKDATLLPASEAWVESTYDLENHLSMATSVLKESTKFLGSCLSTEDDFHCLTPLGDAVEQLKDTREAANKAFLKVRDVKRSYETMEVQNSKSSNFLEKVSLPPIPNQPWRSPSNFAVWFREIKDLISSRRANDKISLRSLKQSCAGESVTANLLKYVDTYQEGIEILKGSYLPEISLGPDITRRIYAITNRAKNEQE